jgi:hypothetical protein
MKSEARKFEICFALYWAGIALLGIYITTVVVDALPVRFLDPAWIQRVCDSLRGGVTYPLIALLLILLGAYLDNPESSSTYLPRLSWWAFGVAVGFFLMIPLQTVASMAVLNQMSEQDQKQLGVFSRGLERIRLSLTEEQLSAAIGSIPGAPYFKPGTLTVPLPQARQMLIQQIEPQLRLRSTQVKAVAIQRWKEALPRLFRDGLVALFAALSFAAIGRNTPDGPTLLERILLPGMNRLGIVDPHVQTLLDVEEAKEAAESAEGLEPKEMPDSELKPVVPRGLPLPQPGPGPESEEEDFQPEKHYP